MSLCLFFFNLPHGIELIFLYLQGKSFTNRSISPVLMGNIYSKLSGNLFFMGTKISTQVQNTQPQTCSVIIYKGKNGRGLCSQIRESKGNRIIWGEQTIWEQQLIFIEVLTNPAQVSEQNSQHVLKGLEQHSLHIHIYIWPARMPSRIGPCWVQNDLEQKQSGSVGSEELRRERGTWRSRKRDRTRKQEHSSSHLL